MSKINPRKSCILPLVLLAMCSLQATLMGQKAGVMADKSEEINSVLLEPLLEFTSKLFKAVKSDQSNVILSPLSIHSAFNLVLLGVEPGSNTEKEMLKALGYGSATVKTMATHEAYAKLMALMKNVTREGIEKRSEKAQSQSFGRKGVADFSLLPSLDIWNLIVSKNMAPLPEFVEKATKHYNCTVAKNTGDSKENQALLGSVNKWAKDAGFDQDVLQMSDLEDGKSESILLMNAVRVQGWWFEEFSEYSSDDVFYNNGLKANLVKKAKVLSNSDLEGRFVAFADPAKTHDPTKTEQLRSLDSKTFDQLAKLNFRAIDVPLIGDLSYTILEPLANGTGDELRKLEDQLLGTDSVGLLAKALQMLDDDSTKVTYDYIRMPPFKFQSDMDLVAPLKSLGMKQAFDNFAAQINRMASKASYVDEAKHKAVIDVNKTGLKASALTVIKIVPLSAFLRSNPLRVDVKNPFIFLVRFNKLPLFIGHLVKI